MRPVSGHRDPRASAILTNLSAIAFAFALIARLSGAARPLANVKWKPRYVITGLGAFLVLVTPLALTLVRVSQEASLRGGVRDTITNAIGSDEVSFAQPDINWPLFGSPQVHAVVVTLCFKERRKMPCGTFWRCRYQIASAGCRSRYDLSDAVHDRCRDGTDSGGAYR